MAAPETPQVNGIHAVRQRRIYLLTSPRTASNLVEKMMGSHSNVANLSYEIMRPGMWPSLDKFGTVPWDDTSEAEKDEIKGEFQAAFENHVKSIEKEEQEGKSLFVKEHIMALLERRVAYEWSWREALGADGHPSRWTDAENRRWTVLMPGETEPRPRTNITMLPDDYLLSWLPVILIRHPALMMPSIYRSYSQLFPGITPNAPMSVMSATLRFSRQMYDWFVEQGVPAAKDLPGREMQGAWPVVLDAADVMRSRAVMSKVCRVAGLDPQEVLYEWPAKTEEEISKETFIVRTMGKTIHESSAILVHRQPEHLDVEEEYKKWIFEFGEKVAGEIRRLTDDAMDDYEYLRERRIRAA